MTKVFNSPRLPVPHKKEFNSWESIFHKEVEREIKSHAVSINQINDGYATAYSFSSDTVPGDEHKVLDRFCFKTGRIIAGLPTAQYVTIGWNCVQESASGTLTWVEARILTGT